MAGVQPASRRLMTEAAAVASFKPITAPSGAPVYAVLTAAGPGITATTQTASGLSVAVSAAGTYLFDLDFWLNSSAGAVVPVALAASAATSWRWSAIGPSITAGGGTSIAGGAGSAAPSLTLPNAIRAGGRITGEVVLTAATTVSLTLASPVSTTTVNLGAGSLLRLTKVT